MNRAVVVGSGIGGSAAAMLLARAGIPTTLVEKNRRIGGSCSGYEKQGFHIDIGTHMFCRGDKGPLGEVLRRVGHAGAIDFRRTRDIAELRFCRSAASPRGARPDATEPRDEVVGVPVPAELRRMPAFAWRLARAMQLPAAEALRAARLFARILTMTDAEVDAWDGRTLDEFVVQYTNHGPTLGVFGFLLGLYFILPYWEISAGEALHCFRAMAFDNALSYPRGGSIAIPSAYVKLAESFGAEVRTGAGVRRIDVQGGRVRGVELEDGTLLPATIVVSTSSLRTTVLRLVGRSHFPEAYVQRVERIRGSYIAVQAKIGLNKKLVAPGAICGGVADHRRDGAGPGQDERADFISVSHRDIRRMFDALTQGRVPPIVPFYCPVPTNFDESLAPPGHQLLTACAVAPTSDVTLGDPAHEWEEAMMRALRRVVPGLDEHTVFVDRFSVDFIEKWIGKEFGPAVSTAQTPDQVGKNRPPVHAPVAGLYFAGCNAGARGVGTELAAASAMECVDRILFDIGRDVPGRRPARRLSRRDDERRAL